MMPKVPNLLVIFAFIALISGAHTLVKAAPLTLIENVTVIDGTGRPPLPNAFVLIDGKRIAAVSPFKLDVPHNVERIDASGLHLIPGLINSHVHLTGGRTGRGNAIMVKDFDTGRHYLHTFLYSGVTAIYDSGNNAEYIFDVRDQERSARLISPRIYATGSLISQPNAYGCCSGGVLVVNVEEGIKKLDALIARKPDMIKFTRERRGMGANPSGLPLMPFALMEELVNHANEHGVRTTMHVSEEILTREAIAAGIDALAHPVYLEETGEEFGQFLAVNRIPISTTMVRAMTGAEYYDGHLFQAVLTQQELEENRVHPAYTGTAASVWRGRLMPTIRKNIHSLYESGAILALGTDRSVGPFVQEELRLLVEAGIPPLQAIRIGTLNAAIYIGVEDQIGSIERGKLADLVLLKEDPLQDIRNTAEIVAVFKGGKRIDRSALDVPINNTGR